MKFKNSDPISITHDHVEGKKATKEGKKNFKLFLGLKTVLKYTVT